MKRIEEKGGQVLVGRWNAGRVCVVGVVMWAVQWRLGTIG